MAVPCPQWPEQVSKRNLERRVGTEFSNVICRTSGKPKTDCLPALTTLTESLLSKQLEEGEIAWYMEMMGLCKLQK
jgi:hypothetical protein